ncbi:SDR family NAD(P)-dependent oxidoreductase [Acidobacteria bacterium AH-259-D05]|nr:SDR family NAD(P)-dependent oxidoreductase [Acidobacteria bacterium AH-259-D05]
MRIEGKSAIVTGGASGLGSATVQKLHSLGAKVVIADIDQDAGKRLEAELKHRALFIETNVSQDTSVQETVRQAIKQHGGLHILVNCAGIALAERVLGREGPHQLNHFAEIIQVNLIGTFNSLRLAAAAMAQNQADPEGERGVIVNTASVAAFDGQIGQAAYSASKGGVVALTLPAARELARQGIRVITIAPGIFDTPLLAGLPEKARISLAEQVPFPSRLGRPEEFASLVHHIVENVMFNGETVRLDGALRMGLK